MAKTFISRRSVLESGLAAMAWVGLSASVGACGKRKRDANADIDTKRDESRTSRQPDLRADLSALVLAMGPWSESKRREAEYFLERYLSAERLRGFEKVALEVYRVASVLPDGAMAVDEIDLSRLSASEREALVWVANDLYGILEIRYIVCGHQPPGVCSM